MKISDIIVESNSSDKRLQDILSQEFDDEFGNPKLPEFVMLDKASVVSLAVGYAKRPKFSTGKAIKAAVAQLYPDVNTQTTTRRSRSKDQKIFRVDTPDKKKSSQPIPAANSGSRGWDDETHGHLRRTGQGTATNIARAINPLSDLDTTDLGTTVSSAARKAKSRMRNIDQFKVKR